ncbi:MAG: permease, partial [Calditrichota bacterium]
MQVIIDIALEVWKLTLEMAPYLLLGFLVAGLLSVVLPRDKISRHLSGNSAASVSKAALIGMPLPLCSCGVIPVTAHLEKQGASRGSVLSFLISTPTSGVDSIFATYALLGPLLAVMRPIASIFGGIATGLLGNRLADEDHNSLNLQHEASEEDDRSLSEKIRSGIRYGFDDLVADTAKWLIIGLILGGLLSYILPATLAGSYLANPWISYPLMLLVGIPMYVCSTGSIPIAASMIFNGMSPGAGFVFLFAGPASNTATLSFVAGQLGRKTTILYVGSIIVLSLLFGFLIDFIWNLSGQSLVLLGHHHELLPAWLKLVSAIILVALIARTILPTATTEVTESSCELTVDDIVLRQCSQFISSTVS